MQENKYNYTFEKSIFNPKVSKKLWLMFGLKSGHSLRNVYMAIKILHQRYSTGDHDKFFYCTVSNISEIAMLCRKWTGIYVWILQKLGLIYRIINPQLKVIQENESLAELVKKFETRVNKKTSFIKVFPLSEAVLGIAISKAPEVSLWLKKKLSKQNNMKTTQRLLKKLEKTMTKEEIKNSKTGLTQA